MSPSIHFNDAPGPLARFDAHGKEDPGGPVLEGPAVSTDSTKTTKRERFGGGKLL